MPMPKLPDWSAQEYERIFVITSLVACFGFVIVHEMIWSTDPQIKNILIGALIGFVGNGCIQYLFGTTPNSALKDRTAAQQADNIAIALQTAPPAKPQASPPAAILTLAAVLALGLLLAASGHVWAASLPSKAGLCSLPSCVCATTSAAQACHASAGGGNGPGGLVTLGAVMDGLADDKTKADVIAQLTSIDWIATQKVTDPTNPMGPPVIFDKYEPLCIPPLIAFLGTLKGQEGIPKLPAGMATGPLVDLYIVARATPIQADNALARVKANGLPPDVEGGCDLFLKKARNLPFQLVNDAPSNVLNFLQTLLNRVTGL